MAICPSVKISSLVLSSYIETFITITKHGDRPVSFRSSASFLSSFSSAPELIGIHLLTVGSVGILHTIKAKRTEFSEEN